MTAEEIINMFAKPNRVPGDYEVAGLLHCGKCHEPKECIADYEPIVGKHLPIACKCSKDAAAAKEAEDKRKRTAELRERCLPRAKMWESTFDNAEDCKPIQLAKRFVEKWGEVRAMSCGLLLMGNVGSGKTFTAQCIANALIDKGVSVWYVSAADMLAEFTNDKTDQKSFISRVSSAPMLIIDDLGAEHDSVYAQSQLCRLIDARVESERPMIITTNYTPQQLKSGDGLKARIFDRILSVCAPVEHSGESRRKAKASKNQEKLKKLLFEED